MNSENFGLLSLKQRKTRLSAHRKLTNFLWTRFIISPKSGVNIGMALVVRSKVKEAAKGMRCSGDFFAALDTVVANKIKKASERAKGNGRSTLRPVDL